LLNFFFISLPEKFDPMVVVFEETKDLSSLGVQELLGSLKSHKQMSFQSKLLFNAKNHENKALTHEQSERNLCRGASYERNSNDEGSSQRCNICKKSSHVEKDYRFKGKSQCFHYKKFGLLQKDYRL